MNEIIEIIFRRNNDTETHIPDKNKADEFIRKFFYIFYDNLSIKYQSKSELINEFEELKKLFFKLIASENYEINDPEPLWNDFTTSLKSIYERSLIDAQAILDSDPAAESLEEVIKAYPGFYAIAIHRISHFLYNKKETLLARIFSENVHSKTGIDIHPGAKIDDALAIDHGTGIVIGETTEIGKRVKIYQGVTLGALSVSKGKANRKRHPTIEDDVIIYGNATILGGNTVIGKGSIIGGNVWLTESVAPNSTVFQKSEVKIRNNDEGRLEDRKLTR
jgi:serine O-acetyltransferase